jgi:transposase
VLHEANARAVQSGIQARSSAPTAGAPESANAVARELGIGADVLRRWRDELRTGGDAPAGPRGRRASAPSSDDEELRRLRRENAVLREERDILKKATAFFAKDAR